LKHLVTGGAGFIGSNLVDRLIKEGAFVYCLDNLITGNKKNINNLMNHENFEFIKHDIVNKIELDVDKIWHLACPASPKAYQADPIKTAETCFQGTKNILELAKDTNSDFLMASTSEVYGDPEISPQEETYRGYVNPIGIRSCYDEGKRIAETLCFDYFRIYGVKIHVARIFNTYGPKMQPHDGRVVSNFICQAIKNNSLTVYGDGNQTRSFCYIDDLINGLFKLMDSKFEGPVNLGNPQEFTILELAKLVKSKVNKSANIIFKDLPLDDPKQRKPCISRAKKILEWEPHIDLEEGLEHTIKYFKKII
tara:strand:- start:989 stop:1912 length:924 start_codon:yes stop_codon:yes gene_type:complete